MTPKRKIGRFSKTLEIISFNAPAQSVSLIRGQGQSPASEGFGQANLRATSPLLEADALERAAALNPLRARTPPFLPFPLPTYNKKGDSLLLSTLSPHKISPITPSPYGKKTLRSGLPGLSIQTKFSSFISESPRFQR